MIELAGLPASGKSTVFKALRTHLNSCNFGVNEFFQIFSKPYRKNSASIYVGNKREREMLYRHLEFKCEYPELSELVERRFAASDKQVPHFAFWLMVCRYQAFCARDDTDGTLVVDEGFIQYGTAIFRRDAELAEFDSYFDLIPLPQMVLATRVKPQQAYERALNRNNGQSRRRVHLKHGYPKDFVHRNRLIQRALERLDRRGSQIVEVPCDKRDDSVVPRIGDMILEHYNQADAQLLSA